MIFNQHAPCVCVQVYTQKTSHNLISKFSLQIPFLTPSRHRQTSLCPSLPSSPMMVCGGREVLAVCQGPAVIGLACVSVSGIDHTCTSACVCNCQRLSMQLSRLSQYARIYTHMLRLCILVLVRFIACDPSFFLLCSLPSLTVVHYARDCSCA